MKLISIIGSRLREYYNKNEKAALETGNERNNGNKRRRGGKRRKTGNRRNKTGNKKTEIEAEKAELKVNRRIIIAQKQAILDYLTEDISAKGPELANLVGVKSSRINEILQEMMDDDIIISEGAKRYRTYRLKS